MLKKIIFTILFLFSLLGLQIAGLTNWLFLSLVIHILWLTIASKDILKLTKSEKIINQIFKVFNTVFPFLLVADMAIIFLSTSFGFRIMFAPFYKAIFNVSAVCMMISVFANYYIMINHLIKRNYSPTKRFILILSSFIYPIGVYTIKTKNNNS
jgi:hypothetical protein